MDDSDAVADNIHMSATFNVTKNNGCIAIHVDRPVEDAETQTSRLEQFDATFTNACEAAIYLRQFGFPVNQAYIDAVQDSAPTAAAAKPEAPKPGVLKKPETKSAPRGIPKAYLQNASKAFGRPVSDIKGLVSDTRSLQTHLESLRKKGIIKASLGPNGVDAAFGPYTLAAFSEAAAIVRKTNPNAKDSQIPALIAQIDTQSKAPVVVKPIVPQTGGSTIVGPKKPIVTPAHP